MSIKSYGFSSPVLSTDGFQRREIEVWGRQGGKVLVLAPSIPVAICVIRGARGKSDLCEGFGHSQDVQ